MTYSGKLKNHTVRYFHGPIINYISIDRYSPDLPCPTEDQAFWFPSHPAESSAPSTTRTPPSASCWVPPQKFQTKERGYRQIYRIFEDSIHHEWHKWLPHFEKQAYLIIHPCPFLGGSLLLGSCFLFGCHLPTTFAGGVSTFRFFGVSRISTCSSPAFSSFSGNSSLATSDFFLCFASCFCSVFCFFSATESLLPLPFPPLRPFPLPFLFLVASCSISSLYPRSGSSTSSSAPLRAAALRTFWASQQSYNSILSYRINMRRFAQTLLHLHRKSI